MHHSTLPAARRLFRCICVLGFCAALIAGLAPRAWGGGAQEAGPALAFRAATPPPEARALAFASGGASPSGETLAVNDRYFTRNGRPWFPVMGEFHYARYPSAEWERELLKMKAGGVDIVATYVFWIFHEERRGVFDWSGRRNLRRFVELCARHGLKVWLRVGPWDHGEVRNGGFPDWIAKAPNRRDEPAYLAAVRALFGQIGGQVKGLLWRDGGPIVGVQLENEYRAPSGGEAHMATLLALAREAGLDAPFTTATGWDHAVVPEAPFLPVFGGYAEQFWSASRAELPPNSNFFFTPIRAEDNVGADLKPKDEAYQARYLGKPFLTAEMGGGMAIAYHRRPVMAPEDVVAPAYVKVGSGIGLLGYYMYHGGTNPDGEVPLEESLAAGTGANDLEAKSYDFQAPLGEFGEERGSYRQLRLLHLFLHDFGERLAPMTTVWPDRMPVGIEDVATPRAVFRGDGDSGFLFVNNYQRAHPLPERRGFQAAVELRSGTLRVPLEPLSIPSGACFFWPVKLDLGGAVLEYATAQPVCRLAGENLVVFAALPGVRAEFAFRAEGLDLEAPRGRVRSEGGLVVVDRLEPGRDVALSVAARPGAEPVRVVLLSPEDALGLSRVAFGGAERLCLSKAACFADGDGLQLGTGDPAGASVALYPAPKGTVEGARMEGRSGLFEEYACEVGKEPVEAPVVTPLASAGPAPAVRMNPAPRRRIPLEPAEEAWKSAAVWQIQLPADLVNSPGRTLLAVRYVGDVARLYAGGRLVQDNFYKGTPLEFGLWRLTQAERAAGLTLRILPLRREAPLYLPRDAWPRFGEHGEALRLDGVDLRRRYEARFTEGPGISRAGTRSEGQGR